MNRSIVALDLRTSIDEDTSLHADLRHLVDRVISALIIMNSFG